MVSIICLPSYENPSPSPDGNGKPRGNKPIFPGPTERPTEAPDGTIGKMVYDRELVMDSRK
ncbi:hypothetical protein [Flavobacterium gilvum]|uniref:Uncharacterized protein n=1 Tax=Flavobacterium gilvum TaxID=1492737 RepID=A0AAC9N339_9FLAO|nr:hypothetical protein [Flavobacterium gilvum]AOW08080.1 hypothetical protein EM308_00355 [Flavobacterium gilvum]